MHLDGRKENMYLIAYLSLVAQRTNFKLKSIALQASNEYFPPLYQRRGKGNVSGPLYRLKMAEHCDACLRA